MLACFEDAIGSGVLEEVFIPLELGAFEEVLITLDEKLME